LGAVQVFSYFGPFRLSGLLHTFTA